MTRATSDRGSRPDQRRTVPMLLVAFTLGLTCTLASGFTCSRSRLTDHSILTNGNLNAAIPKTQAGNKDTQRRRPLLMSSEAKDPDDGTATDENITPPHDFKGWVDELFEKSSFFQMFRAKEQRNLPPLLVEDSQLLLYDIVLILNLTASISFWVIHRLSFDYISAALSEGSLVCILWIICGLINGAFLASAVDGHYNPSDERAGPKAAGMLGLHTFISTASLRVMLALVSAVLEHRKVGAVPGEDLVPLEVAFGLVLLSMWRLLHSCFIPRV